MPWAEYKATLLDRMQNSSTIDWLLSYVIKHRENNCPIGLWVSERLAERRLLNDDGIDMSEETWLELTLAFITNEEKQTLQVPARDRRAEDGGAYGMQQLQQALTRFDPSTFKLFRQTNCRDPVALRVIEIDRLFSAEKKKPSSTSASPKKGGSRCREATSQNRSIAHEEWRPRCYCVRRVPARKLAPPRLGCHHCCQVS
jgi:hypothetical protein